MGEKTIFENNIIVIPQNFKVRPIKIFLLYFEKHLMGNYILKKIKGNGYILNDNLIDNIN